MARSIVDICNVGLGMVGGTRITLLSEDSENARLCNTFYDGSVDEVLVMHDWGCAKHTKVITADSDYDSGDFDYAMGYKYAFPSNPYCLKIRKYNDGETEYDLQGRFLYSDSDVCELVYTKRITDTNEFDSLLADAVSVHLAIKLSFPLMSAKDVRDELIEYLHKVVLLQAKQADAAGKYVAKGKYNVREAGR